MKKIYSLLFFVSLFLISCEEPELYQQKEKLNNPVNNFTWRAMNSWYNWQEQVPNLQDNVRKSENFNAYLNGYSSPEKLFNSLLYREGKVDRFSWFIEDYDEQAKQFQGVYKSFGFRLVRITLKNGVTALIVSKVSKNSPASRGGLKRGDLIIGLNNQKFIEGNYKQIVQGYFNDTAEFVVGKKDGKTITKKVSLTSEEVADDAIHLTKIFEVKGKKVGYLVYNGFRSSYDEKLNETFLKFKSEGITDLILDLRYNTGGSLTTCTYLASLIYGEAQAKEDVFAKLIWNKKHEKQNGNYYFLDMLYSKNGKIPLNRLSNINTLYVLTSGNTASASEMIINGLSPYMNVVTIGTKTYGKNVGSITLFDSPSSDYTDVKTANKSHKNAMQPITFQIFNKLMQSDYTHGFEPNIKVNEFKNLEGFLAFGDENETLLKTTLNKIKGVVARKVYSENSKIVNYELLEKQPFQNEMYIENEFLKK